MLDSRQKIKSGNNALLVNQTAPTRRPFNCDIMYTNNAESCHVSMHASTLICNAAAESDSLNGL